MSAPEEEVESLLKRFEENEEWFSEHYEELQEKYADMILAIKDRKVILVSEKMEELLDDLEMKNEDIGSVFITSIPPRGMAFIL